MTLMQILDIVKEHNTLTVIVTVILLSGIEVSKIKINPWSWLFGKIGKLCNREILERLDALEANVEKVDSKVDKSDAISARARILDFGDELRLGVRHSQEHYRNIFSDIQTYNAYCTKHADFENNMTVAASDFISRSYQTCLETNDFL